MVVVVVVVVVSEVVGVSTPISTKEVKRALPCEKGSPSS